MKLKLISTIAFISCTIILIINYSYFKENPTLPLKEYLFKRAISMKKQDMICHFIETNNSLPNIQDVNIERDKSIFFIETSCNSYSEGSIYINPRQACAVESAAILNPNRTVYLLYASPGKIDVDSKSNSSKLLKNLLSYSNIQILRIQISEAVLNTPVEKLWLSKTIFKSMYPLVHVSDILRLLILWKYGGIYLDTDVIVIKSLESIPLNFVGAQSTELLNNAIISFSRSGVGHKFVEYSLHKIAKEFDGQEWAANGPALITNVARHFCNAESQPLSEIINTTCHGEFRIYPIDTFYPVQWQEWEKLLNEKYNNYILNATKNSLIVHFWNKLSSKILVKANTQNAPYIQLAANYCSGTLLNIDEIF